ncbi:hypothetical protein I41_51310 [Lacipirellula limnantheis]|uniref:Leucine Rich repeats (2 copies) n=2 Tax=Lacipirellula limnantheis TaxID=2528024 RepID=A0A517U5I3_9BACT|nr:hypothetical protein I41_51310 [Lacipirellula limnantheis]
MAGVFVAILGLMVLGLLAEGKRDQQEFEKRRAERWQEDVSLVKAGNDGSRIFVNDPTLVEMLANEPECIANLTTLYFSMADLDDDRFAAVKKLTNLRSVGFYDCQGMDAAAKTIEGMPSIEEIWCEGECFTAAGVKSLATLPNLKRVEFVWEVDPASEQLLRSTLPNVEIKLPPPEELEEERSEDRAGQK